MFVAMSELTRGSRPLESGERATCCASIQKSSSRVGHHGGMRARIIGIVAAIATAASVAVVATASTSSGDLPSYTNGYEKWQRINAKPFTKCGPPCAHSGIKNVYVSKRKLGKLYPRGTVVVKTVA